MPKDNNQLDILKPPIKKKKRKIKNPNFTVQFTFSSAVAPNLTFITIIPPCSYTVPFPRRGISGIYP